MNARPGATGDRHLLVRRPVRSGELAFFTCQAPACTALADLVRVTAARWGIEVCF